MPNVSLAPGGSAAPNAFRQTCRQTWRSLPGVPAVAPGRDAFIHSLIQAMVAPNGPDGPVEAKTPVFA
jgi:hypothetical protein